MTQRPYGLVLALCAGLLLGGCSLWAGRFGDLPTPPHVDLARYMGHWRIIANIPYFAEAGCHDSIESYALRPDGDIDNWFSCRKDSPDAPLQRIAQARAVVVNRDSNAEWNVLFYRFLKIKYVVLAVDPDYRWAAIAHPSRQYGWIVARDPTLPEATYQHVLSLFAQQGYDVQRFVKVPQALVAAEPPPFR